MKAIVTKYLGPSDRRGSRVTAFDGDNRVTVRYDDGDGGPGSTQRAHRKAALALCDKLKWKGCDRLVGGGTKQGYVFVFVPESCVCSQPLEGARGRSRRPRRSR